MKIRNYLATAAWLLFATTAIAQFSSMGFKSTAFNQFKATKTCLVKTGVEGFDTRAIAAMEAYWKITPYQVITREEMETMLPDKSFSFLTVVVIGEMEHGYKYFALLNGGKKKLLSYMYADMLAYSPINRWGNEPRLTDCGWRVSNMIESMVKAMEIVQKEDYNGNSLDIVNRLKTYYNKRAKDIPNRTLLVASAGMGKEFKDEVVLSNYPFKVEICSREKIEKAILDKSTEYYYFQPGMTMNKNYMVVDPSNGDILFCDFDIQGTLITEKNIKKLVATIQPKK
jgi:hypothetical protein